LGDRSGSCCIYEIDGSPFEETGNVFFPYVFFIGIINQKMRVEIVILLKEIQTFFGK
jgi:hypothetical protein